MKNLLNFVLIIFVILLAVSLLRGVTDIENPGDISGIIPNLPGSSSGGNANNPDAHIPVEGVAVDGEIIF